MDTIIQEWRKLLNEFRDSVGKEVAEIRRCKAAVQNIRPDYVTQQASGRFIRSNDPIIISSPNIIIGNVDADGNLIGGTPGKILLRGTNINLEGVGRDGEAGSVVSRATSIRQIAVDPGIDGLEAVVMPESEIVSQARRVSIDSSSDDGIFINTPHAARDGVSIKSDTSIDIDSSMSLATRTELLDRVSGTLDALIADVDKDVEIAGMTIDTLFDFLEKSISDAEVLKFNGQEISSKIGLLDDLRKQCEEASIRLNSAVREMTAAISKLAEAKRQKRLVDNMKQSLPTEEAYDSNGSQTSVRLNADAVSLSTRNGNGKYCVNPESGITLSSKFIKMSSADQNGTLIDGSSFYVASGDIEFNATSTTYENDEKTAGTIKSVGDFNVFAKNVTVKSVDSHFDRNAQNEEDKHKETGLAQDGKLKIKFADVNVSTVGTDGKAAGTISMNSKTVSLLSADLGEDKTSLENYCDKGKIVLGAERIVAGDIDEKFNTSTVEIYSNTTAILSTDSIFLAQDSENSIVLDNKSVFISSNGNKISGETEITGKTKVAGGLEADDTKISNLQVSGEFKTNSISDGIKAPSAGGGGGNQPEAWKEVKDDPIPEVSEAVRSGAMNEELARVHALNKDGSIFESGINDGNGGNDGGAV